MIQELKLCHAIQHQGGNDFFRSTSRSRTRADIAEAVADGGGALVAFRI